MKQVVDLSTLHADLKLTKKQKKLLGEALGKLMEKYQRNEHKDYFAGVVDGLNNAAKMIDGTNDDYNSAEL